ncbi:amidohydrolase family protein [Mycobacterium asiaticum]|uniref:amidohydrolase family protein n=1 Tax=Mycobacterium asiaticum TaxID=1790 RepID=UPI00068858D8|nr:amidohydrolase family protein [Mycobacterium asiaticum]ORA17062.1 amidohydrolase [Mycobacterium asiaticum DSM 44297]
MHCCADHDTWSAVADPEPVRKIWRALGLPGIVDVHTHFMPRQVMDKVWRYFDSAGPLIGRPWPITYRADEQRRLQALRDFGVLCFDSLVYPHKPDMAAWLNQWARSFADATPDCLATATFFPEPDAGRYVADAIQTGTRIFKAHIQVGQYDPTDALLDPVWGAIAEAGVPVVLHAGSGPTPGRFTGPDPVRALLRKFPRLALIIAHMGMPEYSEFLDICAAHDNVRLDTTMAFTAFIDETMPYPTSELPRVRDLGHRILFGSDFPNIPYPYGEALTALTRIDGIDDEWLRKVLHDNAVALFGATDPTAAADQGVK